MSLLNLAHSSQRNKAPPAPPSHSLIQKTTHCFFLNAFRNMKLQCASVERKNDPNIVLTAIKKDWATLNYASKALQAEPAIVLAAVRQDGRALQFASVLLQNYPSLDLAAVSQNGRALKYASLDR